MRYARLYADDSGESHFDDVEIDFDLTDYVQMAAPLELSETFPAAQLGFMRAPAGWASDFHVANTRMIFVVLDGEWEVNASDGESRRFASQAVLLIEDTRGKGHSSRVVSDTPSTAVMAQLT